MGAVATAAGAGLAVRHLQKVGWSFASLAGSVALVGGLVLLGVALRESWRALHRGARLWLLPASVVVLAVMLSVSLAVMYAVSPRPALGARTPADLGLTYTDVTFRAPDGVALSGWYVPGRNGAAVVLRHGAGSTRTGTLDQAAVLARHGYAVLLTDARGHGRSGGRGMDLGWYGESDIAGALDFLAQQAGVDPGRLGVVGLSMGGEEAIGSAVDSRVRAVVAEGATARTAADKRRWLPHGVNGAVQRALDRLTFGLTDLLTPAETPPPLHDAVAGAGRTPFLLITAGAMPDERRAADDLRSAAPDRVTTWDVAGAGHTGGLRTRPQQWESRVIAFLDTTLLG